MRNNGPDRHGSNIIMKDRIYICHTFYHVYITVLKELNLPREERGKASVILSTMSNDFGSLDVKLKNCGLFVEVMMFHEKVHDYVTARASVIHVA